MLPQRNDLLVAPLRTQWHKRRAAIRHLVGERQPQPIDVQHAHVPILIRPTKHPRTLPALLALLHGAGAASVLRSPNSKTPRYEIIHRQPLIGLHRALYDTATLVEIRTGWRWVSEPMHGRRYLRYIIEGNLFFPCRNRLLIFLIFRHRSCCYSCCSQKDGR